MVVSPDGGGLFFFFRLAVALLVRDLDLLRDEYRAPARLEHRPEDGDAGADGGAVDLEHGQHDADGPVPRRVVRRPGRGLVVDDGGEAPDG